MTKEEIREKHLNKNGLSVTKNPLGESIKKAAYAAMDEYAAIQAIAFAEWVNERYTWVKDNCWDGDYDDTFTTDQIYELFLEQQTKHNG